MEAKLVRILLWTLLIATDLQHVEASPPRPTTNCCQTLRVMANGKQSLANLVGFANGKYYWMSLDKRWVIYVSEDEKNWIVGGVEELGSPKEINSYYFTDFNRTCPEFIFRDPKGTVVECEDRNHVTLKRKFGEDKYEQADWLKVMDKRKLEKKVHNTNSSDICGRRPWTNVKDYQKIFPTGHPQGFSGLPYGPDLEFRRRRRRIIGGDTANYGKNQ